MTADDRREDQAPREPQTVPSSALESDVIDRIRGAADELREALWALRDLATDDGSPVMNQAIGEPSRDAIRCALAVVLNTADTIQEDADALAAAPRETAAAAR
jgi:hypothetical protein